MKISLEQVIAGALLKFGKVDNFIIQFIVNKLQENLAVDYVVGRIEKLKTVVNENVEGFCLRTDEGAEFIFAKLQEIAGFYIIDFIDSLDLKELVMRKVEYTENYQLPLFLSHLEEEMIDNLHSEGYLATYSDDNTIVVTNKGAAYLFILSNESEINGLKQEIRAFDLRDDLLEEYFTYKMCNGKLDNWEKYECVRYREFTLWYEWYLATLENGRH